MKTNESWDLSSVGDISSQKIQRNLRELAVFSANSIRSLKDTAFRYDPIALMEFALEQHRSLSEERKGDGEALRVSRALVSYLAALVRSFPKPLPKAKQIKPNDWKNIVRLFDDIVRKSIRMVDNTALLLKSEGHLTDSALLEQFQEEASGWVLPPLMSSEVLKMYHRSLLYQLQPYNLLISEVFSSHLDGVLNALMTLIETGEHSVLEHTSLTKADALLLATLVGSEEFRVDNHRLTQSQPALLKPFIHVEDSIYCFDPERVLLASWAIIKNAVTESSDERKEAWEKIEEEKQSLLSITFFTALLSSMHYTRNVEYQGGYLDALFEENEKELVIQVPATHTTFPVDPLNERVAYAQALTEEANAITLAKTYPANAVIIDTRRVIQYPVMLIDRALTLSFSQVATLATTWEGANEIKGELGLLPFSDLVPPKKDEHHEEEAVMDGEKNLEDELEWEEDEDETPFEDDGELLENELGEIDDEDEYEEELQEFEDDETDEYAEIYEDDEYEGEAEEEPEEEPLIESVSEPTWQKFDQGFTLGYKDPEILQAEYLDYIEEAEESEEEDDEDYAYGGGLSYFTSSDPLEDYLDQDEFETADEMVFQSEQPVLFDLEDEQMFDPFYRSLQEQEDVEEDYESEALDLFESEYTQDDDDDVDLPSSLVLADEEMEEGKEDLLRYHTQDVEDDDGDEFGFLHQIRLSAEEQRPASRFTLVNAVEQAKDSPPSEEHEQIKETAEEVVPPTVEPFALDLPPNLAELFNLLAKQNLWSFNTFLKESMSHVIESLERMLEQIKRSTLQPGQERMFTITPLQLTIIVLAARGDTLSAWTRKVNVAAIMHANNKRSWHALSIAFDREGRMILADEAEIKKEDFTPTDWKFVMNAEQRLREKKRV